MSVFLARRGGYEHKRRRFGGNIKKWWQFEKSKGSIESVYMALPFPASSPMEWTDEDAAFFSGVLDGTPVPDDFAAMPWGDMVAVKSSGSNGLNNEGMMEPDVAAGAGFAVQVGASSSSGVENESMSEAVKAVDSAQIVRSAEVRESDVVCIRGTGHAHAANKSFRDLIVSHKDVYDTMTSEDRLAFSEQIWASLQEKGVRFLRPLNQNSTRYEVLDHERSVRKILHALRDCRRSKAYQGNAEGKAKAASPIVEPAKIVSSIASTKVAPGRVAFGKRKKREDLACEPKNFDDDARAEIAKLYQNEAIRSSMIKSWKENFDVKRQLFEEQVSRLWQIFCDADVEVSTRLFAIKAATSIQSSGFAGNASCYFHEQAD